MARDTKYRYIKQDYVNLEESKTELQTSSTANDFGFYSEPTMTRSGRNPQVRVQHANSSFVGEENKTAPDVDQYDTNRTQIIEPIEQRLHL
jgi:hypothetical protein